MLLQVEVCGEVSSYRRTFTNYAGCSTSVQRVTERKGHRQPQNWPLSALPSSGIDPTKFTAEQLAFLERKRAYKAGETSNPLQAFTCNDCGGKGTVVCWECAGAGVNHRDIVQEVMGGEPENVRQQNGVIDVSWFLMKGGPCFVCRGKPECPCRACEGTGIKGFKIEQYSGD